jgi:hypothetical protein
LETDDPYGFSLTELVGGTYTLAGYVPWHARGQASLEMERHPDMDSVSDFAETAETFQQSALTFLLKRMNATVEVLSQK